MAAEIKGVVEEPVATEGMGLSAPPEQSAEDSPSPGWHLAKEPWRPETARDIEWLFSKREEARQRIAEVQASLDAAAAKAQAYIAALNERAAEATAAPNATLHWAEATIAEWARANREAIVHGKVKSRKFLGGTVGFREAPERLEIPDKGPELKSLVAWLEVQDPSLGLARVKLEPAKDAIQAHFRTTGEIPPGCEHRAAGEIVTVKAVEFPSLDAPKSTKELTP